MSLSNLPAPIHPHTRHPAAPSRRDRSHHCSLLRGEPWDLLPAPHACYGHCSLLVVSKLTILQLLARVIVHMTAVCFEVRPGPGTIPAACDCFRHPLHDSHANSSATAIMWELDTCLLWV